MKKQTKQKQVSTPIVVVVVVVVMVILAVLGRALIRPRMPEAPPELQGRSREAPESGMMKGGGMLKSGQARQGMTPGKAPD